jgi:anti-sigma regulatory factor (Ser/Thr protein kinase)
VNEQSVTAPGDPNLDDTPRFRRLFPTTARGAHRVRHAAERWLAARPGQHGGPDVAFLLVAELTANAARHGRVPGRSARLALTLTPGTLRIEVTDARGDRLPVPAPADAGDESGRGLLLVASLADDWGWEPYPPGGKTVWARCPW